MSPRIHFHPITAPAAQVIPFPNTRTEDREAIIAQLSNHHAVLVQNNGSYLGRHKFLEAAVAVAVRQALEVGALEDARAALLEAFDYELSLQLPVGFAG